MAPTRVTMASAAGAYSKSGDRRATMNTPAVTMVAAWISAETGVGPSIASGSQVCRPSWADLPMAPTNSSRQATRARRHRMPRNDAAIAAMLGALAKISSNCDASRTAEDGEDAEREAEVADPVDDEGLDRRGVGRRLASYQKPISR